MTWPLEGSNDTGWITLDAVGAVPETGQRATADWELAFAPGAELSNVTLEVRASGQNGTTIEEPHLVVDGMGTALFDWRGLGAGPSRCVHDRHNLQRSIELTATRAPDGIFHRTPS